MTCLLDAPVHHAHTVPRCVLRLAGCKFLWTSHIRKSPTAHKHAPTNTQRARSIFPPPSYPICRLFRYAPVFPPSPFVHPIDRLRLCLFAHPGCVITGNMSDIIGRKPVVVGCLLGTVISHIMVARSTTLAGVAWGRIIGGVTGGLTPIAQAAVADVVSHESRDTALRVDARGDRYLALKVGPAGRIVVLVSCRNQRAPPARGGVPEHCIVQVSPRFGFLSLDVHMHSGAQVSAPGSVAKFGRVPRPPSI